jgi:hypothetical protein
MRAGQKLYDNQARQVALFILPGFHISQRDDETYSHDPSRYWATDYLGWNSSGRVYRDPCYAPVDIKLVWKNATECMAIWESLQPVHMVGNRIDYLTLIVYHDNDIQNNSYYSVGTIKRQGEQFNKTGTGGNVTGDHVHLETGYGRFTSPANHYHIENSGGVHRLHNYECLYINDTSPIQSPGNYNWVTFQGGSPTPTPVAKKYKFKWVLYANKLRDR